MSITANPKVNIQLIPANIVDAFGDRLDLLAGQMTGAGTATDGALYENVQAMTPTVINGLFGARSN